MVHFRQMHSFIGTQMFFASWTNTFCNLENTISSSFYPPPSHVDPHEPLHERRLQGGACLRPIMRQRMQPMLPRVLCSYKFYIFSLSYYGISAFTNMTYLQLCEKQKCHTCESTLLSTNMAFLLLLYGILEVLGPSGLRLPAGGPSGGVSAVG